jgi:hypothetical protein
VVRVVEAVSWNHIGVGEITAFGERDGERVHVNSRVALFVSDGAVHVRV